MDRIALVTGGNRGLGKAICEALAHRGYHVLLTARDRTKAQQAAGEPNMEPLQLDVTDPKSIEGLAAHVEKKFGRLDVLVNNAGIYPRTNSMRDIKLCFETNTLGAFLMCRACVPLMQKNNFGRIVNVSSGMGQLSTMSGGSPAYRISKTALNAVTRIFAAEANDSDILVNSVCPGWVKTDMGGGGAPRSIAQGVEGIVWAATLPKGGPTGGFFRDGKPIEW